MAFTPLYPAETGLSDGTTGDASKRSPESVAFTARKAAEIGKSIMGSIAQPFVSLAATPVQLLAKGMGQPDPYADFQQQTGMPGPSPLSQPLKKVGEAGEVASYFFPYGRFEKLGTLGKIAGGALGGYGVDVSSKLAGGEQIGEAMKPGLGTALGAAIPGAPVAARLGGKVAGEALGVSTGTGFGVIRQAYEASREGGEKLKSFTEALRGRVAPDEIVQEARDSLGTILSERRESYVTDLKKITENKSSLDVSPIIKELENQLKKFSIKIKDGVADFSQSAIRFDKEAQRDVQTIIEEMKTFGMQEGDRTALGVDSLKRALGDLYSKSSNVRALVQAVKSKTSSVLSKVPGYEKLAGDYAEKTKLIDEIQRGLSLGDQAMVDTTYKKLISSLRLNNEQRKEMIEALEQASGGQLGSKIAGQQMSEALPRGIMRPLGGAIAGGAVLAGQLLPLLKFAAFASPRLVGESLRIIGFADSEIQRIMQAIGGLQTAQTGVSPAIQSARGLEQQGTLTE